MQTDILRAELERLFELDELAALSTDLLGFEPSEIGGTAAKGSFADALTSYCVDHDAVEALCEALLAIKSDVDPRIAEMRNEGVLDERLLRSGDQLASFRIARPLGEGRVGIVYLARAGERDYRVKLLHPQATRDQRGLHRYLTLNRLIARIDHPGLPRGIQVGRQDGLCYVAHEMIEGQTLTARTAWAGPMHLNEVRPLLNAILQPLKALHDRRLTHGDLHLENIIVTRSSSGEARVVLVDAGCDRLRVPGKLDNGLSQPFSTTGSPNTVAPEQIQGQRADARSDVYSCGAIMYQLLSGRPVFTGTPLEAAFAHLNAAPASLSQLAPRGWVTAEVEELVLGLLAKDPSERPQNAGELAELLERFGRRDSRQAEKKVDETVLTERIEEVLQDPLDEALAQRLESLVEAGADPRRIAEAFCMAADILDEGQATPAAKTALWLRAARLYESNRDTLGAAEKLYESVLALLPDDEIAMAGLEETRKRAGKFEELIEMLLQKNEKAQGAAERADNFAEIGRLYAEELKDREQALIAFTQAFTEKPEQPRHAMALQRIAGDDERAWEDVLSSLGESAQDDSLPAAAKTRILLKMAEWYQTELQRSDLAASCLNSVLASEPNNDVALATLADIYRRSQQWRELGITLSRRAETAPAPLARDLRTEAAEILEHQLGDPGGARDLYERVLEKDPGHTRAAEGLSRIFESSADFAGLARIMKRKSEAQRGEERRKALCRLAEIQHVKLGDTEEAILAYRQVLDERPTHLEALRGLDEVLVRTGRFGELLEVLERQIDLATTPRQRIALEQRLAALYEDEFLDHERAAACQERILELDVANRDAIRALMRHYRALERWEPLSSLYEKLLQLETDPAPRLELALTWGRLLSDQLDSPQRALRAYELVLEMEPRHEAALDALARLKESTGDASAALEAILLLADKAQTPHERSQQLLRAAKLCRSRGDLDRAIELHKQAADADPDNPNLRTLLREAYVARGDIVPALKLLELEIDKTEGERAKAKLAGEMARLARVGLGDDERAEAAAKRALAFDPTDLVGLTVLGDLAFEHQRFVEASRHYESVAGRAEALEPAEAKRVLGRYIEALARSEKLDKAGAPSEALFRLASDDVEALEHVARLTLEFGEAARAVEMYQQLLDKFESRLPLSLRAPVEYRYGEALRRLGELHAAREHLERASQLDPELDEALAAQAKLHAELENWHDVVALKTKQLVRARGDARHELLVEIGDIAQDRLQDRAKAVKSYLAALEERPGDRRVLTKLMQHYSEEEAWDDLVEVVLKLANFVEEPVQKAKYLETAAVVNAQQIGNLEKALEYYERAFALKPSTKALDEALEIYRDRGDTGEIERLLRMRLELDTARGDKQQMLATFSALAELYERDLGDIDNAVDAYEAAHTLDPESSERAELLSELYTTDPKKFFDKGVRHHAAMLKTDPYQRLPYRRLRRLYTEVDDTDASWCLCQTMSILKLADDDEKALYKRLRSDRAAAAETTLGDDDWLNVVLHPMTDPLLTSVFALIEPAVIGTRAESLEDLGYGDEHRIDLSSHYAPLSQSLHHAAGVLAIPLPPAFENTNDPGGLSFLHTHEPSIVLGNAALTAEVPSQPAAFIAARHLSYLRPGLYLRQLVGTGTGLKSWLFAAIKLTAPGFPVAAELEGPIGEALDALKHAVQGKSRDHLTRVVTRMLQSEPALDLKRWIAGVDLTSDRAGLIMANDLATAVEILQMSDDSAATLSREERLRELILFSASPEYFELRKKLGIRVSD